VNYPKYWIESGAAHYGYDKLCQKLVRLILKSKPKKVYDLACGIGFPFIEKMLEKGIEVSGSDKSFLLVQKARESYPRANLKVGGYSEIVESENTFDVSYCARSSFYLPDIKRMIDELVRITKPGGKIIFDITDITKTKKTLKQRIASIVYFRNTYPDTYYPSFRDVEYILCSLNLKYETSKFENKIIFEITK